MGSIQLSYHAIHILSSYLTYHELILCQERQSLHRKVNQLSFLKNVHLLLFINSSLASVCLILPIFTARYVTVIQKGSFVAEGTAVLWLLLSETWPRRPQRQVPGTKYLWKGHYHGKEREKKTCQKCSESTLCVRNCHGDHM